MNMLAVRNCCYVAICSAARGASSPTGVGEAGHIVAAARLQLFILTAPWGESSLGRIVCGARRPWGETSMGRNVLPWGEVSMGRNVRGAKSPDTTSYYNFNSIKRCETEMVPNGVREGNVSVLLPIFRKHNGNF